MSNLRQVIAVAALLLERRAEATPGGQLKLGAPDRLKLRDTIYRKLVKEYETRARSINADLGGDGKFELAAQWKQRELMQKARVMSDAVARTTRERLESIKTLPPGQRGVARKEFLAYKAQQLEDLIAGEGQFQAQCDMLAHSGIVNVDKARVMYFRTVGVDPPHSPCPICSGLASGNPYTIRQATTLGPKAHPNCKDGWQQDWQVDDALRAHTRRQVRDGEVTLWGGQARTPARGKATDKQGKMQRARGGWKGLRTQQRRVITQRSA